MVFSWFQVHSNYKVEPLAQIEMESLAKVKAIFCWCKTATSGARFVPNKKSFYRESLKWKAGLATEKNHKKKPHEATFNELIKNFIVTV